MPTSRVTVVARLAAKPGLEAELRKELRALVEPSRADAGCLNYDLHEAKDQPGCFLFHENWESVELLDSHLQTPHLKAFFAKAESLVAAPPQITLWDRVG